MHLLDMGGLAALAQRRMPLVHVTTWQHCMAVGGAAKSQHRRLGQPTVRPDTGQPPRLFTIAHLLATSCCC
jgi:hypothetical protein